MSFSYKYRVKKTFCKEVRVNRVKGLRLFIPHAQACVEAAADFQILRSIILLKSFISSIKSLILPHRIFLKTYYSKKTAMIAGKHFINTIYF